MGLPFSVLKTSLGLVQGRNNRYQRADVLKQDTGILQNEYLGYPRDPKTEKCHLSWRNETLSVQQRDNPLRRGSEPRSDSLWAAPDSEIEEVDRIV